MVILICCYSYRCNEQHFVRR